VTEPFYFSPHTETLHLGGAAQKAENNLRGIRLIKQLDEEGRSATPDEQNLLAMYTGWGDSSVLHHKLSEVVDTVTEEEWVSIQGSTLNAHYTSLSIIRAMWSGVMRLGAGNLPTLRVLDPSAGIGHFFSAMPDVLHVNSRWVEIELDKVTAKILKYLHPDTEGRNATFNDGFENVRLIENQFDLVISNVPFGNYPIADCSIKESFLKSNIHDYFFVKALSLVKPGGVIAFITSRYTLDKKNKTTREWLARRADLLAAIRLPDTAFVENAGTQVVTDIIFLRKRHQALEGSLPIWVDTEVIDPTVHCYDDRDTETDGKLRQNRIYGKHPAWIIGNTATRRGMYTREEYTVKYDDSKPIGDVVAEILEGVLPEDAMVEGYSASNREQFVVEVPPSSHVIEISQNTPIDHRRRLEGLREIYDAAQQLLDLEIKRRNLLEIEMQREQLNSFYDKFVMRFGPISNKLHQKLLEPSPALPFLLALECDYQPLTNSAQKAPIFRESTVRSAPAPDKIQNCNDALLFCLNQIGSVDIGWIAELAGVTEAQALAELGERVLWTPEGELVASEVYLSGNIAEKLEKARALVGIEPRLKDTIDALQSAMPKPLKPGQIKARLGSGWIPAEYVCQFIEQLLPGITMQATYIPKLGSWTLDVKRGFVPAENTSKYGTKRYSALALLETGLNAQTPVVYDTIDEGGREKRVLNQQETVAAQAKLEELKARFDTWLWQDADRAERLAKIYNTRFNVFARPHYDGSHLTLPGLSKQLTLRSLQKDAVWFGLQRLATLIGDEVGLGKTLTAIVSVMEAIRLGAAHKAVIVVPNHLTGDWRDAFLLAYPRAKVLCAGKNDLKKNKRREFMSRIAMNRWDAVIIPQSSFKLLPVKPETLNEFIEAEIEELRDFLNKIKAEKDVDRRAKKEIEKAIKRFEAKLVTKSDMSKDSVQTITWDQMGIDLLVVDEFHSFKNLYFHSKMTRIAGLPNSDSQRAFDMFVKVRDILQRQGRFIGLTGTPIANTMAEAFTLQRYFSYDQLVEMGLSHFDSWAQMFADAVMMPEMTPDGSGFRVNTRLARFTNIPELSAMLSQFMIMRQWKEVSGQVERPILHGGKPTPIRMPGSKPLKEYVKQLAKRAEEVRSGRVEPKDDNMLKIVGDGRKAALDLRLVLPGIADLPTSKINTAAWNIAQIYHRTHTHKSAQLIFCDLGTPKPHKDSANAKESEEGEEIIPLEIEDDEPVFENVYADIKAKLVQHGVRPAEIAFIHDAKSPADRSHLFEAVRRGRIRVLIGSTEKMGTGMNVQTRALAMHHMDAPWRPADLEQREGRLVRQGNMYSEVFSFVYIVEGSFDGYVWQILETKARFIEQFLNGQTDVREMDDVGETVLSMAEIKALASGNPKIMERVMVQNEILKLEQLRLSWQNERRHSQRRLSATQGELEQVKIRIEHLNTGARVRDANTTEAFSMKLGDASFSERRAAGQQLIELARVVKLEAERTGNETRKKVGSYRGFILWLRAKPNSERSMQALVEEPQGGVDILLDYNVPQILVAHVSESDSGTVASIDAAMRSIDGEISKSMERRDYLSREILTLEALLRDPWEHAEKLESLAGKLSQLDQELIAAGISVGKEQGPGRAEHDLVEPNVPEEIVSEPLEDDIVRFDLNEILSRMDELHSTMLPMDEDEPIAIPIPESAGIPITLQSIEALEREAESAQVIAEFGRSILSGTQMRLTDLLDMGMNLSSPAKKPTRKKSEPSQQLRLF
jgi:N12 class adenine-specific DNA methylase